MPPFVIDIRNTEDTRDVVHRAVQALAEGKLVVLPTETVYGLAVAARNPQAVQRLLNVKRRTADRPFALAVKSADDALDYAPRMSTLASRLARRCWPGPVTLVVEGGGEESLVNQLPPPVRQVVAPRDLVGLRVPAHAMILDVLRMLSGPLVLTSANRTGQADPVSVENVVASLGDDVDLVLEDGPSRYGQPSTVVQVVGDKLEILRPGVVAEAMVRRLSSLMVLLVCTGNTCRSPMAEAILRNLIAKRLGCDVSAVENQGVIVMSAGISATNGGRPTPEAVDVMRDAGIRLDDHESQPLTDQLVRHADRILTMTRSHRHAIVSHWPAAADRVQLLRSDQNDIADPIGGPIEVYRRCAEQMSVELERIVGELELP